MPKVKRIVVDASVARSAGSGQEPNETSGPCREALSAIRDCHRIVFSQEGFAEWRRHQHSFARGWLRGMVARRKVDFLAAHENERIREGLQALPGTKIAERRAMLKDAHLLEAALLTDRVVISRERIVRALFHRAAEAIADLRRVHWANPEIAEDEVQTWLRAGAKTEARRTLGA